jgi:chemotaxis protein histidine kinase CheA
MLHRSIKGETMTGPRSEPEMTSPDRLDPFTQLLRAFPPANPQALTAGFRTSARLGERLSRVALHAADSAADISGAWTKTALSDLQVALRGRETPKDYASALGAFAAASVEVAGERLASFAEVAKRAQVETIEVLLDAHAKAPVQPTDAATPAEPRSLPVPAAVKETVAGAAKPKATAPAKPAPKAAEPAAPAKPAPRRRSTRKAATKAEATDKPAQAKPTARRPRRKTAPKPPTGAGS